MILHDTQRRLWVLESGNIAYALGITPTGLLSHSYFGERLPRLADYPAAAESPGWASFTGSDERTREEFPAWSGTRYTEPCLKATFADSVRDVVLGYRSCRQEGDILTVVMADAHYPLQVEVHYRPVAEFGIVERWATILNQGDATVTLNAALTGAFYLPGAAPCRISYLIGKWVGETQLQRVMVPDGKLVLESRRGATSHHANPWAAFDCRGEATEELGTVFYVFLAFSGNWKITVERDAFRRIKVCAGVNDFDFAWSLGAREPFTTPVMVLGCSTQGFGGASRACHAYQRTEVLAEGNRTVPRKVLYNSWEATGFDVTEAGQAALARQAAELGVELFVVDDGWFGARDNDRAGLGDWESNPGKFPHGLERLVDEVNRLGMEFGLWVEPEMVNPDSDLYRAHPDWVYHFPTRERTLCRSQLVLNLARADVQEFIFGFMDRLLTRYNIKFIKWDKNRNFSEPGWPDAPAGRDREIWVRHARALYSIVERLRARHPGVFFQSCSGGGGRVDLGILRHFDQAWTSDNTDAFDRLAIQHGYSQAYCAATMECWVTHQTNWVNRRILSLPFRFHSAMMGVLGVGDNITTWSDEEKASAKALIALYKEIRPIVQFGDQYRLLPPLPGPLSAVLYVDADKSRAVLFVFLQSNRYNDDLPSIHCAGLAEERVYQVEGVAEPMSGRALRTIGVKIPMKGDFQSAVIQIRAVASRSGIPARRRRGVGSHTGIELPASFCELS